MSYTKPGEILEEVHSERLELRRKIQELEQKANEVWEEWSVGFFRTAQCKEAREYIKRARELREYL